MKSIKRMFSLVALIFSLGLSIAVSNVEAANRVGSGKSMGTQRQATQDKAPAGGASATGSTAAAGAAAASKRSWMGPIAGLAAGLGLAALASHLGFGEELASMMMMGLLAAVIMVAIGFFMRKRAMAKQGGAMNSGGMLFAPVGSGPSNHSPNSAPYQSGPAYKVSMPADASLLNTPKIGSGVPSASRIPSDFDSAGFERNAKVNFIRLQAANDAADLNDLREFTTPEMFAELQVELAERGASAQKNDVTSLKTEVIEVNEDATRYLVSVRFEGIIHERISGQNESFSEIWHFAKPLVGSTGWVLSGIQQAS